MAQQDQNVTVLVADDEPSTLALVASHVRSRGYTVLEASDGDQAWQLAHEHLPDLVILDVMMPGMSGWEVCRKIREAVSLAHTGVIMLTGIGENLNEMTSPLYGADTYLDKPFEFTTLDEKVAETLADRKKGAMGRPDPEVAAARQSSRPPPAKTNGLVLARARKEEGAAPKAKRPAKPRAKAKEAAPKEAARPLVKAALRKETPAAAKPATAKAASAKPKMSAKAKPRKASKTKAPAAKAKSAPKTKAVAAKARGAKAPKATAKKAAAKKSAKLAAKPAAKKAGKGAKAAPKKAAPKKAAKTAAKAARKKVKAAPKKAAPVSASAAPTAKKAKPRMARSPSGNATA